MTFFARARVLSVISIGAAILVACAVGSEAENLPETDSDAGRVDTGTGSIVPPGDSGGEDPIDGSVADAKTDSAPADACSAALAKITYDFEAGASGWTHAVSDGADGSGTSWPYDPWLTGTASVAPACKAGKCFGTELTKNYAQCQRGHLLSPVVDLSACAGKTVALVFQHAYSFWTGSYNGTTWFDGGVVEASSNGTTWQALTGTYPGTVKINPDRGASYACVLSTSFGVNNKQGFVGVQTTTAKAELTIPASAISKTTRIRFSFASGVSSQVTNADSSRASTAPGWRIDDVGFVAK